MTAAPPPSLPGLEARRRPFLPILAVLAAAVIVSWLSLQNALDERATTEAKARTDLSHQAEVAAKGADMMFQGVHLALMTTADSVRDRAFSDRYSPRAFHDALRRTLTVLPQVDRLVVYDETGVAEVDSAAFPSTTPSIARSTAFTAHAEQLMEVHVAPPGHGVDGQRATSLLVSRRIEDLDGAFRGVVVAEVNGNALRDVMTPTGMTASAALIDHRGLIITAAAADFGAAPPAPGKPLNETIVAADALQAVHQLSVMPLRVIKTAEKTALADVWWRKGMVPALLLSGVVWIAALGTILLLLVQRRREAVAERAARTASARLEQLVRASPAIIYGVDVNDPFCPTYISPNLQTVSGHTPETVIGNGMWWHENVHPEDHATVLRTQEEWVAAHAQGVLRLRYRFRRKDGAWRWVEDHVIALRDPRGAVRELIGSVVDVTEAAEVADRLARIAHSVPGMIYQYRLNPDGTSCVPYCSEGIRAIFGVEPEVAQRSAETLFERIHPDDRPAFEDSIRRSAETSTDWAIEVRILHPEHGEIWVSGRSTPERQPDGTIIWHGYIHDITARRRAEEALRGSEERLSLILRGTNDAPWDWDVPSHRIYYAPRWWEMLGLEVNSLPSTADLWMDRLHPDDRSRMEEYVQRTFADLGTDAFEVEFRLRHARGHHVPVLCRGVILRNEAGQPLRLAGANTDLTVRKALESALAESERLYRGIFESVTDSLFLIDVLPDGGFRFLRNNPAHMAATGLVAISGFRPEEALPRTVADHVNARYASCVEAGEPVYYEETLALPNGTRVWSTSLTPIRNDDDRIVQLVGVARDITEAKHAEAQIRESRERLASYFAVAPLGIYVTDAQGRYLEVNAAACRQSGYSAAELTAMRVPDYVLAEDHEIAEGMLRATMEQGNAAGEVRLRRKDGGWFWGMVVVGRLPDGKMIAFVEDITERKRMEDSLQRSNTDLEQFAYVASHDLRQPLRMVNSYLQLTARRLGSNLPEDVDEFMGYARDGANRMDQLLVALLEYSRVGRMGQPMSTVDIRAVVEQALAFLRPTMEDSGAQVIVEGDWPTLTAAPDEMLRLFQNLIGNALKYHPPGETPVVTVSAAAMAADSWRFTVTDNGIGIVPDQIPRLFKVFQRLHTREEYDGTGIGLAICRKIVDRHGGCIWAESQGPGQGTTLAFVLPLTPPIPIAERPTTTPNQDH